MIKVQPYLNVEVSHFSSKRFHKKVIQKGSKAEAKMAAKFGWSLTPIRKQSAFFLDFLDKVIVIYLIYWGKGGGGDDKRRLG